jgi:hypothetical protein
MLTDSELSKIRLIDYDTVDSSLPTGWSYTPTANEFGQTIRSHSSHGNEPHANDQAKNYYVSTTKVQSKKIAASIRQPDNTLVATNDSYRMNGVTVTG